MNGLTGTRRLASPVRLTLAKQLGADIDGAWWPHTASVARELPELVEILHPRLGEVADIRVNWSAAQGQSDLSTIATESRWSTGLSPRRLRLMMITGSQACVRLLVLPCKTAPALGGLVMRCAAGLPRVDLDTRNPLCQTAESVVQMARTESAGWLGPAHAVAESPAVI